MTVEKLKGLMSRREFLTLCGVVGAATLAACTSKGRVWEEPQVIKPEVTPTPAIEKKDGTDSPKPEKLILEDKDVKEKIRVLFEEWICWWLLADKPPITLEVTEEGIIDMTVMPDVYEPKRGEKALVVMENNHYPGQYITQPWDTTKGDFMTRVPGFDAQGNVIDKSPGHINVAGLEPLMMEMSGSRLSDGREINWVWQNVGGRPARMRADTGELLERIGKDGKWKKVREDDFLPEGDVIT